MSEWKKAVTCGCRVEAVNGRKKDDGKVEADINIFFCPLHSAAPETKAQRDELLAAAKEAMKILDSPPNERVRAEAAYGVLFTVVAKAEGKA